MTGNLTPGADTAHVGNPASGNAGRTDQTVRVIVDRSRCSGIGICESIAPEYFEVDVEGTNHQAREVVADDDLEEIEEAVRSCPAAALSLQRN